MLIGRDDEHVVHVLSTAHHCGRVTDASVGFDVVTEVLQYLFCFHSRLVITREEGEQWHAGNECQRVSLVRIRSLETLAFVPDAQRSAEELPVRVAVLLHAQKRSIQLPLVVLPRQ